ncbi:DUF4178 domain-containing protein [Niabella beijingensis]|uniref:DUF4178 domain-containing protein n=1 Tax=Niabella beijingensis TaxID=2872700 RepID=UPI001CBC41E1|nr:DUF4178 domain-containing protein [Niabella beijingensis]MBZ4187364.1 DUF4178 domain-containing protein [Niabella beijingensis]
MYQCPNCKKALQLPARDILIVPCECGMIVNILQDTGATSLVKDSIYRLAPESNHYLQPGTTGLWKNKKFAISGRFLAEGTDGAFSYWTIIFEDGGTAVLSEGYGHYSILQKITVTDQPTRKKLSQSRAGTTIKFNGDRQYRLIRRSEADSISIEGALCTPEPALPFFTAAFFNEEEGYIEIQYYHNEQSVAFSLDFLEPRQFKFGNTVSGSSVFSLQCEKCNTALPIVAIPYTRDLICFSCKTEYGYNYKKKKFQLITKAAFHNSATAFYLQPGNIGSFNRILFTVIGCCSKEELSGAFASWREYTLFNPVEGFSYLSEYNGHWVYVKEWPRPPLISKRGNDYFIETGNRFDLYNKYRYKVTDAIGEHIYDINNTRKSYCREFVCPPQLMIEEKSDTEECWFYGEHINPSEVKEAFKLDTRPPARRGIGSIQPLMIVDVGKTIMIGIAAILLMILFHIIFAVNKRNERVITTSMEFSDTAKNHSYTSNRFYLNKKESNVEIELSAPGLSNNWIEVSGNLVNTDKGLQVPFTETLSFYSGVENGESWSEGGTRGSVLLTDIPRGNYYIEFEGTSDISSYTEQLTATLLYDVPVHRNLFIVLLIVAATGAAYILISNNNRNKRWNA